MFQLLVLLFIIKLYARSNIFKFAREHPCRSAISIKFFCYFIVITPRHASSPVNSLHIFRTPFLKDTSVRLFLEITKKNKMKINIKKLVPNEQKHTETTTSISVTNFKQGQKLNNLHLKTEY